MTRDQKAKLIRTLRNDIIRNRALYSMTGDRYYQGGMEALGTALRLFRAIPPSLRPPIILDTSGRLEG